ncbi:uncharacterized protein LAESUDRAFT_57425 [Laetiporus sulphureus 93-53]|uniref:F-box domain-containing protein n=1 Tax=Laetiporus sulphureus 93-53 TaxID=1314785 RepID=A0A165AZI7_9APHY|nr:uncharacterized protein LAESUDRAFT_57425 [Laetiporus sulphureus 93-53]KZS99946.1 hypothetical protein LAESUDRAFT_57425 [Laetiporus sulphureus 93-53]
MQDCSHTSTHRAIDITATTTTAAMTSLLSLNHDVLSLVLAFLSPHDAAQLALTSHQAHALAMARVLAHVSLGGVFHKPARTAAHQLTSFCRYMLADVSTRLSCLRSLTIMRDTVRKRVCGVWAVDVECVCMLSEMLARGKNLQKVTVWGMDALVQARPQIVDALAGCEFLHTVCLGGEIPELSILTRAFPHVRSLQFVDGGGSFGADWGMKDIELPQDGWPCLDRVDSGHPILPLARPVRRVDLRNPLPADELAINNALRFIKRTQPVVLSCFVDVSVPDAAFVARIPEVAGNLKFLELILHGCESLAGVTSWMVRVYVLFHMRWLIGRYCILHFI